jgi:hypothetical protein
MQTMNEMANDIRAERGPVRSIKAVLIDPDAHAAGGNGVQTVELSTELDGRSLDIDDINRLLGSESFESAASLLRSTARNATLYVDACAPDDGAHWCWTWGLSEPVVGKGLILGVDAEGYSIDTPIPERDVWTRVRFARRLVRGFEMMGPRAGKMFGMDTMIIGARRIAPIVDQDGNELLIQQTFMSGKPLIPNYLAEKLFGNWSVDREAMAALVPVVKLFMVGGWEAYITAVDPKQPTMAFGAHQVWPPSGRRDVHIRTFDLDEVAQYRLGMLPVERDLYIDLDQPLTHYAEELSAA